MSNPKKPSFEIAILSYNKSEMTLNLLRSIQKFEPDTNFSISVLDQASDEDELRNLEENISDQRVRLIKGIVNLGVGGGRQKQLAESESEWILFLDNDLEFQSSFFEECLRIQEFSKFGCLPFTEINDEGITNVIIPELFVSPVKDRQYENAFGLGASSRKQSDLTYPFPITGVAGGVFLANVQKLLELGGIRGPGKAGYEDLDVSLRLLKSQERVVLIDLNEPLVHNKHISSKDTDRYTELNRLDPYHLRANARFVETNHKGHVWGSNQYEWLTQRSIKSQIEVEMINKLIPDSYSGFTNDERPKVLLVCDIPGWAFERIAKQQQNHLAEYFNISITYSIDWESLKIHLFSENWDSIIFLWRAPLFQLVRESLVSETLMKKIGYCVYDHQGEMGYEREVEALETRGVPIGVVNETLYSNLSNGHQNIKLIPDGVDTGMFRPFKSKNSKLEKLVVGWSGNTKWGGIDDVKGFNQVIKPCIELIKDRQENIEFRVVDSSTGRLPHSSVQNEMKNWDVVVCASAHEGTPNPILEGLANGLVVVSTPIGMTPELVRSGANIRLIDRTSLSLFNELKKVKDLKVQNHLSKECNENRSAAIGFDWRNVLINHKEFIDSVLKRVE
jgi:glycosyltransferase involved in cell wall biosynthesis